MVISGDMKYRKATKPKHRLTVYLSLDFYRRLQARARTEDRTLSALVAAAIRSQWEHERRTSE